MGLSVIFFITGHLPAVFILKILKEGSEGPEVVTVQRRDIKNGPFEMKFTAPDQHMKIISINDTVKISEGPLEV